MKGILICTCDLLLRHLKHNLILIFQIAITFLTFLGFMGRIQFILNSKNITDTFSDCKAYYYYPYTFTSQEYSAEKILADNKISGADVGTVYYMLVNCNGEDASAVCYNETIIDYVNIKLSSGKWLDKYSAGENNIPVISVGNKYKLYEKLIFKDVNDMEASAVVVGTITEDENILTFNTGANSSLSSLDFFVSKPYCDLIVPFDCMKIQSLSEKFDIGKAYGSGIESYGEIIIPENNISNTELKEIFKWYGTVADIEEMMRNYSDNIRFDLIINGVVLAVFLTLTIAGIGGINGMQSRLNQRNYIIYYMLGMSRRSCALTELLRSSVIVIIALLASSSLLLFKPVRSMFYPPDNIFINWLTVLCAFLIMELISCLISIKFVLDIGNGSIIDHYKNHE